MFELSQHAQILSDFYFWPDYEVESFNYMIPTFVMH